MSALSTFAVGLALGLSLAAPPGPMNAIVAEESVLRGWPAGFKAGLGAMTADACFLVLALTGVVTVVEDAPLLRSVMVGAGGVLMLYFAYHAARGASGTFVGDGESDDGKGFRKAFVLALTNPYQVVWWLTAGIGLLHPGAIELFGHSLSTVGGPVILVGFFGGILCWVTGFPAMLVTAGRRVDSFAPTVAYVSALVLAGFGLSFLYNGLRTALSLFT